MKTDVRTTRQTPRNLLLAMAMSLPAYALAASDAIDPALAVNQRPGTLTEPVQQQEPSTLNDIEAPADTGDADTLGEVFSKGKVNGNFRTLYYSAHNSFFTKGLTQDTLSYGGKLGFTTARYNGFSAGLSGYVQRGIGHADDPSERDGYLGPNVTAMGEAYLQYEHDQLKIVAGNQELDVPFASTYDWRIATQLFQGVYARYGDDDNFLSALRMYRYKSYIDDSFKKQTTYNSHFDAYSGLDDQETDGFWGVGGGRSLNLGPAQLKAKAWQFDYEDYAKLSYVEAQLSQREGVIKPFIGVQAFHENGDGRELLGEVHSRVYGLQLGVKHNSLTASLGYDRIEPDKDSYLNGALVTPYAHNVSSGPLFAQPFLTSTQDLGAGNAYAFDVNGALRDNLFVGGRYSFMDLKASASASSINQSEYLAFAIYKFGGNLKGLSVADFIGLQSQPGQEKDYWQNRLAVEYAF
ncbi:MAG: OprD family outer membrane porin [Pseudomonas sp.]|nr:OprD family outer membrane porin [Pseudomonas sp.]